MRTSVRFLLGTVAIAVLAACGSPTDSLAFKVPPGWTSKAQMGLLQIWPGANDKQILMLMKLPVAVDVSSAMNSANMKDAKVESQQDVTICNGQKAQLISATGQSKNETEQDRIDMLMTAAGGNTYMAMYVRPVAAPTDAAAEASLRTVCLK